MPSKSSEEFQQTLDRVKQLCMLSGDLPPSVSDLENLLKKAPDCISQPALVFIENVYAALKTAGIPETFAKVSILTKELEALAVRHRIEVRADSLTVENMGRDETPEERTERDELAQKQALKNFQDGMENPATRKRLMRETIKFLSTNLENQMMETAVKELLRQTVVMIWGAFEVLCRDIFPSNNELIDQLKDNKLLMLHQRRHLIVHRRAVVDKQYLNKTGEKMKIGEQLTPTPAEIEEYIKLVCESALMLVKAAMKK